MTAGLRLSVGLLTVLPVGAPRVDRGTARTAMLLAPVVGLLLAGAVAVAATAAVRAGAGPLLTAAVAVTALALLTRGMHLDGLADTADGLGSARPAAQALEIMRRSDIGPFGVVTLVLVLLLQVAAAAELLARGSGGAAVLAVAAGRLVLPVACSRRIPGARPDGLGATVASVVPVAAAAAVVATGLVALAGLATLAELGALAGPGTAAGLGFPAGLEAVGAGARGLPAAGAVLGAGGLGLAAGALVLLRCVRRFGGITGDVLGACVEVTQVGYLLALVALT